VLGGFIRWVVIAGFVGAHVLELCFYAPEKLWREPLSVFAIWNGLSSYGGFIGAALGAWLWAKRHRAPVLPYADLVASGLPLGWVLGRAGCALVHDHPGIASDAWFAVAYPGGGRLDLGLMEMALTIPIAVAFIAMQRSAWPWGFFISCACLAYAPLRFGLDFLRIREPVSSAGLELVPDARYAGLTPAQWASLGLAAFGAWLLARVLASASSDAAFAPPPSPGGSGRSSAVSYSNAERGGCDARDER
jgi:phosphatidylglycerol:prolipoprotein diacylglycerol transferase